MLLDRRFKPEVACSKDAKRPTLNHPILTRKGVIASDGIIAVRVPCEIENDDDGQIPVEAIKLARQIGDKKQPIRLDCNGAVDVPEIASFERHTQEELVPKVADVFGGRPRLTPTVFAINAEHLARAAKALGTAQVKLEFFTREHGVRVSPLHGLGGEAIVMPVRLPEGDEA